MRIEKAAVVSIDELAESLGLGHISGILKKTLESQGIEMVADWRGRAAVPIEVAAQVYQSKTAEMAAQSQANFAYGRYLDEQREKMVEEAKARRKVEREELEQARKSARTNAQRARVEEVAAEQARRNEEVGAPLGFDEWRKKNG